MSGARRANYLPFARPSLGEEEIAEVVDTLRSGWLTTGPKVQRFEREFAQYLGASQALAVNSCTAGLEIALAALGIGPDDEVILPTITFCATANVVVHRGARPVLVDVEADLNLSPAAVEAAIGPKTRAIVPVHYGGQPCDLDVVYSLAAQHRLAVVEDAAHAVGASYHGHMIGSDALVRALNPSGVVPSATVFSFYATKNLTTGEGGMIVSASETLAERIRPLILHGMSQDAWKRYGKGGSWRYDVIDAGYKANMSDLQAALGIHQLRKLDEFLEIRRRYARRYDAAFAQIAEIRTPVRHGDRTHGYHLYPIGLDTQRLRIDRAAFIEELAERGIGASVHFIPLHLLGYYREQYGYNSGDLRMAEALYEGLVSLPLYPAMSAQDVDEVAAVVTSLVNAHRR